MADLFLGIDLGTSGLKAAAVTADGVVAAEAEAAYVVASPAPGYAEIAAQDWVTALRQALADLGDHTFTSVGVAGQMHGVVLVDEQGAPCRPAMLWPDRRAQAELAGWHALSGAQRVRLANPITPGMAGPMLRWVLRHEPTTAGRARVALQPKDYLRGQLGGPAVTERSDASATLLWDVPADGWALDVVADLGLPASLLPDVVASHRVVGEAELPGRPALVTGAGDTPAALLGTGGLAAGEVQVNLGTGAQILIGVDVPDPVADPVTHLYADTGSAWYRMAGLQNGGLALNAVRRWLGLDWPAFFAAASSSPVGAGGVSVLPFLAGERGGVAGPNSRGAWLGLSEATTAADIARAAVEGMVFAVRQGVELLAAAPRTVRVSGGGVREAFVAQMLADVLGAEVRVIAERSASALGAAMLAALGVGVCLPVAADRVLVEPHEQPLLQASYGRWVARLAAADL